MSARETLIHVDGLKVHFPVRLGAFGERKAVVQAVDGIDFDLFNGETLSLVGESGCGKSTTGFAVLNLRKITGGRILYRDVDLTSLDEAAMRGFRKKLQIVFQNPYATLNPRMTIGNTLAEPMLFHGLVTKRELDGELERLLAEVGLPKWFASRYPHELSGGQRQRVAVARALACQPEFIVCDEAISALDVSIQAQIINLLMDLQDKYALTYLFIAHDLAVVRHISNRVGVMYLGRLTELAPRKELFSNPLHPYTQALLSAVPVADPAVERARKRQILQGDVPSPLDPPSGCRFHTRCHLATDICRTCAPQWSEVNTGHFVACHRVSGNDQVQVESEPRGDQGRPRAG